MIDFLLGEDVKLTTLPKPEFFCAILEPDIRMSEVNKHGSIVGRSLGEDRLLQLASEALGSW